MPPLFGFRNETVVASRRYLQIAILVPIAWAVAFSAAAAPYWLFLQECARSFTSSNLDPLPPGIAGARFLRRFLRLADSVTPPATPLQQDR